MFKFVLIDIADAFVAIEFIDKSFQSKRRGVTRGALFLAGAACYYLVMFLLNRFFDYEGALGFLYGAVLFFYARTALCG